MCFTLNTNSRLFYDYISHPTNYHILHSFHPSLHTKLQASWSRNTRFYAILSCTSISHLHCATPSVEVRPCIRRTIAAPSCWGMLCGRRELVPSFDRSRLICQYHASRKPSSGLFARDWDVDTKFLHQLHSRRFRDIQVD